MHIIWNLEAVENLKNTYTLLELETFHTDKGPLTAWCLLTAEQIIVDIANLDNLKQLHQTFLTAAIDKNYKLCKECAEQLIGRFSGELDTFYQEIISRDK